MTMNKLIVGAPLVLVLAACVTSPERANQEIGSGKFGVVQVGSNQNAELVFCETNKCPQRTLKRLPPSPPVPVPVIAAPQLIKEDPKERFKVHFRWGWSQMDKAGRKEIAEIVDAGLFVRAKKVEVAGRTDPTGPLKYNEKLALRRAETVKAALVKAGVPAERITTGVQAPCCDGDRTASKAVMRELRRTDIEITVTTK